MDESDYNIFHNHLFKTDSVLLEIKLRSGDFLCPVQIDSLRGLLRTKEMYLFRIMKAINLRINLIVFLTNELPIIATQTVKVKDNNSEKERNCRIIWKEGKDTSSLYY